MFCFNAVIGPNTEAKISPSMRDKVQKVDFLKISASREKDQLKQIETIFAGENMTPSQVCAAARVGVYVSLCWTQDLRERNNSYSHHAAGSWQNLPRPAVTVTLCSLCVCVCVFVFRWMGGWVCVSVFLCVWQLSVSQFCFEVLFSLVVSCLLHSAEVIVCQAYKVLHHT